MHSGTRNLKEKKSIVFTCFSLAVVLIKAYCSCRSSNSGLSSLQVVWQATPLARSRLVAPLNWEFPEQPHLSRHHLPSLLLNQRGSKRITCGQPMKQRQSPGVLKARQICFFSDNGKKKQMKTIQKLNQSLHATVLPSVSDGL